MVTLFFVHGTGVRQKGYQQTKLDIWKGLTKAGCLDVKVEGVSWGEELGVKVTDDLIARMLPPAGAAAKGDAPTIPELEAALWAALMDDPLFELRLTGLRTSGPVQARSGALPASQVLKDRLRQLDLGGAEPAGGVSLELLKAAATRLSDGDAAPVLTQAAQARGQANDPSLVQASARAVVAYALLASRGEPGEGPDALYLRDERARLVAQVEDDLSEGAKGIDDWLKDRVKDWALAKATNAGKERRTGLMHAVSPGTGDILLTQRRGEAVQARLKQTIEQLAGDVVVIGHSLGGVLLVNLLSGPDRPKNVSKLVTVASQSAFFTACDSMATLRLGEKLPADFPPWLNVYDPADFLSFCAGRSFTGGNGVRDFEISSGVPFPDSHGAYWRMPALYTELAVFLGGP